MTRPSTPALALSALLLLVAFGAGRSAAQWTTWHGDEAFYTDGALFMLRSGDFLTPRYPDGSARFNKPPLTYWLTAASFAAFGPSPASARLPSVLLALLTLTLVARTVRALDPDPWLPVLSATILGTALSFWAAAARATPDIALVTATTLALSGLVPLIDRETLGRGERARAWGGVGLAVAAKGFAGLLVPMAWLGALALVRAGSRRAVVTAPFRGAWWGLGVALGGGWFAAVLGVHGPVAWQGFFADQVGDKTASTWWGPLSQLPHHATGPLRHFAFWVVPLLVCGVTARRKPVGRRAFARATLLVGLALVLLFSLGNLVRARYLLPAYPLFAVVLALEFRALPRAGWLRVFPLLLTAATLALGAFSARLADAPLPLLGGLLALGATAGVWRARGGLATWLAYGAAALLVLGVVDADLRPRIKAAPTEDVARAFGDDPPAVLHVLGVSTRVQGQIRLRLAGRTRVVPLPDPSAWERGPRPLLVGEDEVDPKLVAAARRHPDATPCGTVIARLGPSDLGRIARSADPQAALEPHRRPFVLLR
jgi:4-amino-4-deoxy-L-arabinose transferase-like glycosyltransferase